MIPPPIFPHHMKLIKEEDVIEGDDYFDLLPDPIVGIILNRLQDAKSLCRCLLLSKRFASIVPQVDSVTVLAKPSLSSIYPATSKKFYSRTFLKSFFRKLLFPASSAHKSDSKQNIIGPSELSRWISNSVRNFVQIRDLRVQLPDNGGIVGFPNTDGLLKWTAEFGKELERCAIIGATAFEKQLETAVPDLAVNPNPEKNQSQNDQLLTDLELKSRVVWIVSCLIAACARHGVVKQTLMECKDLRSAEIMDACHQGKLSMNEKQIKEIRESISEADAPIWKRTMVPSVAVKLWYAPELVLPKSGYKMKGATVIAVQPSFMAGERECEVLLKGGFDGEEEEKGAIGEAVREILKSKWKLMYKLEMNRF